MVAYAVPDEVTPRVGIGRAYYVSLSPERTYYAYSAWRYVQVSMLDRSFTKHLLKPPPSELPFRQPAIKDPDSRQPYPMPKDEVLSIVDFVHQPSSYREFLTQGGMGARNMVREILESPVSGIERTGSVIDVRFGFNYGGGLRQEVSVTLEFTPDGYRVTKWGWVI
jgi:hypothetical protein